MKNLEELFEHQLQDLYSAEEINSQRRCQKWLKTHRMPN